MFQTNILNFTSRVGIARHGFESVTLQLTQDYQRLQPITARHGTRDLAQPRRQGGQALRRRARDDGAWRKILEQTTSVLLRQAGGHEEASA